MSKLDTMTEADLAKMLAERASLLTDIAFREHLPERAVVRILKNAKVAGRRAYAKETEAKAKPSYQWLPSSEKNEHFFDCKTYAPPGPFVVFARRTEKEREEATATALNFARMAGEGLGRQCAESLNNAYKEHYKEDLKIFIERFFPELDITPMHTEIIGLLEKVPNTSACIFGRREGKTAAMVTTKALLKAKAEMEAAVAWDRFAQILTDNGTGAFTVTLEAGKTVTESLQEDEAIAEAEYQAEKADAQRAIYDLDYKDTSKRLLMAIAASLGIPWTEAIKDPTPTTEGGPLEGCTCEDARCAWCMDHDPE